MMMKNKALMKKYNLKQVAGGSYGEGFFDCLEMFDTKLQAKIKAFFSKMNFYRYQDDDGVYRITLQADKLSELRVEHLGEFLEQPFLEKSVDGKIDPKSLKKGYGRSYGYPKLKKEKK